MRYRKVRAALPWISTFLNVTLHCCTPAHAENIHGLSVVATGPYHDTSLDHWVRRAGYGGIWQTAFGRGATGAPRR